MSRNFLRGWTNFDIEVKGIKISSSALRAGEEAAALKREANQFCPGVLRKRRPVGESTKRPQQPRSFGEEKYCPIVFDSTGSPVSRSNRAQKASTLSSIIRYLFSHCSMTARPGAMSIVKAGPE